MLCKARRMRILLVHNHYRIAGGEDAVVSAERRLLEDKGQAVALLESDNADISGALDQFRIGVGALYPRDGNRRVAAEIKRFRPDVMRVHNFFPRFSPSIYSAAPEAGVAVVQTLHNYRLLCPNAMFLRNRHVCEDFVRPSPPIGDGGGGYALFVGRLSEEKGVRTLLAAWKQLAAEIPLKIVGDGPLADTVKSTTDNTPAIEWLGRISGERVITLMQRAALLIFPSIWYEGLPVCIVEAFAVGLPSVTSNLGGMSTLIRHGETGLHIRAGDVDDLVAKVRWAQLHPTEIQQMRRAARREFEAKYTADRNYEMLLDIYQTARLRPRT